MALTTGYPLISIINPKHEREINMQSLIGSLPSGSVTTNVAGYWRATSA